MESWTKIIDLKIIINRELRQTMSNITVFRKVAIMLKTQYNTSIMFFEVGDLFCTFSEHFYRLLHANEYVPRRRGWSDLLRAERLHSLSRIRTSVSRDSKLHCCSILHSNASICLPVTSCVSPLTKNYRKRQRHYLEFGAMLKKLLHSNNF